MGKNAEALGEDCQTICCLGCLGAYFGPTLRWRIRQEKGVRGSMAMDGVCWLCCPFCVLCQEARELGWNKIGSAEKGDVVEEIQRE